MFNLDCNFFTGLVIQIFSSSTCSTARQTIKDKSCSQMLEIGMINCMEPSNSSQVSFFVKRGFLINWKEKKCICHLAEESLELNTQVFFLKDPRCYRRRAVMAQSLSSAGAVVPSVLLEDSCTGTEIVPSLVWQRTLPSSELSVIISSVVFLSRASSQPSEPFFWLLRPPTTQVQGNMINGFMHQPSMFSLGWQAGVSHCC